MSFWQTLFIAAIPAILTGLIAYFGNRLDYLRFRSETMAERTVRYYLSHKGYTDRKFTTIKKSIGRYKDDELRRILVRAGAERSYRGEETEENEYWNLLSRKMEKIQKKKSKT
ncbi:hypothetical protein [Echinicola sp. 20G]|uniref:hypothetical protein n=1 Tax=Echinicola sp. 20G TaxID=2781961 RepID=UPI001910A509|nr:hypothetical protein [Echinicola sp. 20G]